jgi:hypothetical protein
LVDQHEAAPTTDTAPTAAMAAMKNERMRMHNPFMGTWAIPRERPSCLPAKALRGG